MKIYNVNDTREFDTLLASRAKLMDALIAFYHTNQLKQENSQKLYEAIKQLNNGKNEISIIFNNLASLMPSDLTPQGQADVQEMRALQQAIKTHVNTPFNLAIDEASDFEKNRVRLERDWVLYPSLAIAFIQVLAIIAGITLLVLNLEVTLAIILLVGVASCGVFIQAGYWGTPQGFEKHFEKQTAPFKKLKDNKFDEAGFDGFALSEEELERKLTAPEDAIKPAIAVPIGNMIFEPTVKTYVQEDVPSQNPDYVDNKKL
jgi:hypothetical protein